jgi:hypothetical protein
MYVAPTVAECCMLVVTKMKSDSFATTGAHSFQEFQALLDAAVDGVILIDHQSSQRSVRCVLYRALPLGNRNEP